MKLSLKLALAAAVAATTSLCSAKTLADTLKVSYKIDDLLEVEYKKKGFKPNEIVSDGAFARRAYINIVGRIPTAGEAKKFIDNKQPGKRIKLIDSLIESDGFKGKVFLFYADLLRLRSTKENHGAAMHEFLYQAAHKNRPYDKVVNDLLSAKGHVAENPAASYYLRDEGMILDNVSNSVQVFLGTQIGCAQCHDHPFEDTTQMDFYKMAAFSGGISFRKSKSARDQLKKIGLEAAKADGVNLAQLAQKEKERQARAKKRPKKKKGKNYGAIGGIARKYARPATPVFKYYQRNEVNDDKSKELKLPHDYQYNDAEPEQVVKPGVIFGSMPDLHGNGDRRKAFADWVTSPTNPMFSKVIANRLWAHAFGYGLAEPLDNWTDRTKVSHEAILDLLAEEMKNNGYDIRQTLRTIYFSTLFQRTVSPMSVNKGKTYHFAGPLLRRMKGEELYDSMLVLEAGKGIEKVNTYRSEAWNKYVTSYNTVKNMSSKDVIQLGKTITAAEKASDAARRKAQKTRLAILAAKKEGDQKKVAELTKEVKKLQSEAKKNSMSAVTSMSMTGGAMKNTEMMQMKGVEGVSELVRYSMGRNLRYKRSGLYRAAEHPQPFKAGTFVREFGGTDGEVTNNSSNHASVPQALTMLNGREVSMVTDRKGALPRALKGASTPEGRLEVLFLSIYSRYPTDAEKARFAKYAQDSNKIVILAKAMINSKTFMFVQ